MTVKYVWSGKRCFPIIRSGDIKGTALTSVLSGYNHRYCDLLKKVPVKKTFALKYNTNLGDAKFSALFSMQGRRYSPNEAELDPAEQNVWEAHDVKIKATKLDLPLGYSMDVQPIYAQLTTRKKSEVTYPVFYMDLKVSVGPMIGSWTDYVHRVTWDPRGRKILVN